MGAVFENLTEEELCDLMCGGPENEWEDDESEEITGTQKSMSDPVSNVEIALKSENNDTSNLEYMLELLKQNTMKPITIKACKYLLPCGKCDKTDKMCSQWQFMPLKQ